MRLLTLTLIAISTTAANADVGRLEFAKYCEPSGTCYSSIGTAFSIINEPNGTSIWIGPGHGGFKVGSQCAIAVHETSRTLSGTVLYKEDGNQCDMCIIRCRGLASANYLLCRPQVNAACRVYGYPNGAKQRYSFLSRVLYRPNSSVKYAAQVPAALAEGYSGGPLAHVSNANGKAYCSGAVWGSDGSCTPGDVIADRVRSVLYNRAKTANKTVVVPRPNKVTGYVGTPSPQANPINGGPVTIQPVPNGNGSCCCPCPPPAPPAIEPPTQPLPQPPTIQPIPPNPNPGIVAVGVDVTNGIPDDPQANVRAYIPLGVLDEDGGLVRPPTIQPITPTRMSLRDYLILQQYDRR